MAFWKWICWESQLENSMHSMLFAIRTSLVLVLVFEKTVYYHAIKSDVDWNSTWFQNSIYQLSWLQEAIEMTTTVDTLRAKNRKLPRKTKVRLEGTSGLHRTHNLSYGAYDIKRIKGALFWCIELDKISSRILQIRSDLIDQDR